MPLRRPLALLVGLASLAALVVGGWAAAQFRSATLGRPWFARPAQLVASDAGHVYVGMGRAEIQVYAVDGTPLRAWLLDEVGPYRLRWDAGRLEVVYASDRVVAYDALGQRLGARRDPGAHARAGPPRREVTAGDGRRVALRPEGLVRVAPPPARVLVPAPPRPLALFGSRPLLPISALLLGALLALVACLALARRPARAGAVALAVGVAALSLACGEADAPPEAVPEESAAPPSPETIPPEPEPAPPAPVAPLRPPTPPPAPPPVTGTPEPAAPEPTAPEPTSPAPGEPAAALSLDELAERIRQTRALGVFTKLALKNDIDDLLAAMRSHHEHGEGRLSDLRERFEALVLKLLALLEEDEPALALALARAQEEIWGRIADPERFAELTT